MIYKKHTNHFFLKKGIFSIFLEKISSVTIQNSMLKRPLIYLLYFLLLANTSQILAQLGGHPTTINWQQINNDGLKLIFPEGFEQQATRVANMIEYMDSHATRSIGERRLPIQILLHNQTTIANGFVGPSPYRSEFFATPPQSANSLGSVNWLDGLTIHEYRHAQQYANSRVGLSKLAYYLMGENGWALALSTLPNWFWEGDAVVAETALSKQGRGRSPFFTLAQRSLLLEDINYSYQKARNGSYKDLLPNRYPLGYLMNVYAREHFGNDIWKTVFEDAARYRSIIYPFSRALKKHTGLTTSKLYKVAYEAAQTDWKKAQQSLKLSATKRLSPISNNTVTNYLFPYYLEDGSLVYRKNSYKKTAALYQLKDGKEQIVTPIGRTVEEYLSVTKNRAVWTEFERDPRRAERNYSNIVYYDFISKTKKRLTSKSRFFSPDFSNDGRQLVAVQIPPSQENSLVILEAKAGTITQKIPNLANLVMSFPKWLQDDSGLVFIGKENSQLAIFKYLFEEETPQQLIPWTQHNISDLFVTAHQVYFTASYSGIDNIYAINLTPTSKRSKNIEASGIRQMSAVPIGAYYPSVSPDGQQIVFSEFSNKGYFLSALPVTQALNDPLTIVEPAQQDQYVINAISEEGGSILENIDDKVHPITPYKGLLQGLKLHSWNLTPSIATPSIDIQVDNILQDFSMSLLGGYNLNEGNTFYLASATYGKWYPQLQVFAGSSERAAIFQSTADTLAIQRFDQHSVGGTVSVPLTWTKGDYATNVTPLVSYAQRFLRNANFETQEQANSSLGTVTIGANISNLRRKAYQNVDTRLGQALRLRYYQTTNGIKDQKVTFEGTLFFPGIGANHSIQLEADYQKELLKNNYQFSDGFSYTRGYTAPINDVFTRFSLNYQLPLLYPDWGFGGLTYFKRIRANLFFDYGRGTIQLIDNKTEYRSTGVEILFDNHFFMELPVTVGLRNSFLLDTDLAYPDRKYKFELFVSSEFF